MNAPGMAMYTMHQSVVQDLQGTLLYLRNLGYGSVEWYGGASQQLQEALKVADLRLTSWHIEWCELQIDRFINTVKTLQKMGCDTAVVPCLGGRWNIAHTMQDECRDVWLRHVDWLNKTERMLSVEGIRLGYHNHEHEFNLHYQGQTVFDLLFERLSPNIIMEFDSGNCIEGGGDPLAVLRRYPKREIIFHLKPYSHTRGFEVMLGEADDANDWAAFLLERTFRELLIESEATTLPESENARACMDGFKRILYS